MDKLNLDTIKVKTAANNIKELANEYYKIILGVYQKLGNVESDEVWVSESEKGSAKKFVEAVQKEKVGAITLASDMKKTANSIISYVDSLESVSNNDV